MATKKNQKVAPQVEKKETKSETKAFMKGSFNSEEAMAVVNPLVEKQGFRTKESSLWTSVFDAKGKKILQVLKSKRSFHFQILGSEYKSSVGEQRFFTESERKEFHATRVMSDVKIQNKNDVTTFITGYFNSLGSEAKATKKATKKEKKTA